MHQPVELQVKFLRLNTGEDIIAELYQQDNGEYKILNPLKILYTMNEKTGMLAISLMHWIFPKISETIEYDLKQESIVLTSNASIQMTEYYYSMLTKTKAKQEYEDSDYDEYEDEEDIADEDLEYVKDKLDNIRKNNKRLH
jgi:hypothetical protein